MQYSPYFVSALKLISNSYKIFAFLFTGDALNESKFVQQFLEMGQLLQPNQTLLRHGANELFVGRAGYLCMARWMEKMLGKCVLSSNLAEVLFNTIVTEGRSYSREHRSLQSPLMYSYYGAECLGKTDLFHLYNL